MNDHKKAKLTKTEQRLANLEQMLQMINVGCLSEIRGLMIALDVEPKKFVEAVNDTIAMRVLARNLHTQTEIYKKHQADKDNQLNKFNENHTLQE